MFTVNKWMFTFATLYILPFTFNHVAAIDYPNVPTSTWLETLFVVFICTYVCYILTMNAQQTLRPTVVSVYNYVQPMVAVVVSVITGLGIFKPAHALAVVLVFFGVRLVTKSKSRRDLENNKHRSTEAQSVISVSSKKLK